MGGGASVDASSPRSNNQNQGVNRSRNRNPRYIVTIRDEPEQMLNPVEGYQREPLVTLERACQPLEKLLPDLRRQVYIAKQNCRNPADGLTVDESAAIQLYTMEWHSSLYVALNKQLRQSDRRGLRDWFLYLKLFLTALYKLPSHRGVVWRGVPDDLSDQYEQGTERIWWGLSSCTKTMEVLENPQYLGDRGARTLFSIETTRGKSIKNHSFYQNEDEILLLPGTNMVVTSQLNPGNRLHIIHLKEKRPPFPLLQSPFERNAANHPAHPNVHGKAPGSMPSSVPKPPNPIKTKRRQIHFNHIPGAGRNQGIMPDGYEGFAWENFCYVEESYAQSSFTSKWKNIFKHSRYGIYNYSGTQSMYIRSAKGKRLFSLISLDATVVDRSNCEWQITGFQDNLKIYSKQVKFSDAGKYQLIQLDFHSVDEVKFTTFSGYPELFIGMIEIED